MTNFERAVANLKKLPDAEAGHNRHGAVLRAADVCLRWELTDDEMIQAVLWFNANKCHPALPALQLEREMKAAKKRALRGARLETHRRPSDASVPVVEVR